MHDDQRRPGVRTTRLFRWFSRWVGRQGKRILAVGLLVGTSSLLLILIGQEWDTLRQFQWHLDPRDVLAALLCHAISLLGTYIVWQSIITRLGSTTSRRVNFYIFFVSNLARKIPSMIWYTGARSYLYNEEGTHPSITLNAVALEFSIASLTGAWASVLLYPGYGFIENHTVVGGGVLAVALLLTVILAIRPQLFVELSRRIGKRWQQGANLKAPARTDIAIWSLVYTAAWIVGGTSFHFTARSLIPAAELGWLNSVSIATLVTLVVLLNTVLPAGIGLKEIATGVLLSHWFPVSIGLVIAIAYRILQMVDELLWALIAYLVRPTTNQRGNSAADNPKEVLRR